MAQQQLLLLVLVLVLLGTAAAVSMTMFNDNAANVNRDAVISDLLMLANRAQAWYKRPSVLGGGQNSFQNLQLSHITRRPKNANGEYQIVSVSAQSALLRGIGTETAPDGSPVQVDIVIEAGAYATTIVH